jgi:hypothetical protein
VVAVHITDSLRQWPGRPDAVFGHAEGAEISGKIDQLLRFENPSSSRTDREDDRSQAMFAEGILRTAEIGTKVLLSSETCCRPSKPSSRPDPDGSALPNASGIELTELIRASSSSRTRRSCSVRRNR